MLKLLSWGGYFVLLLILVPFSVSESASGDQTEQIPEPLTLQYALSKASRSESPEIMSYSAQRQIALAEQDLAISQQGIYAYINGRLRYVEPASFIPSGKTNDSKLSLDISKRLYDFGQSRAKIAATKEHLASVEALYTDSVSKRTVAILQAYFNVLLADIIYNHANEAMAVDYVKQDKAQSQFELGQVSDIDFLAIENRYRQTRRERNQALSDQRITRHRLAQLINPGHLSAQLDMPDLKQLHQLSVARELEDVEQLYELAYKQNPQLLAMNHKLESARLRLDGYQAEKYPVISAHLQAADYARELGSSDKFRAGIEISVPLYQAGQENAKIKRTSGELVQLQAQQLQIRQDVEQQILELWLKISDLIQQFSDPDFNLDYRDLYLERSRALYELEVTSDLGDAMVELTQAQLFKTQTVFELAIAWAKLDSLLGKPMDYSQNKKYQNEK